MSRSTTLLSTLESIQDQEQFVRLMSPLVSRTSPDNLQSFSDMESWVAQQIDRMDRRNPAWVTYLRLNARERRLSAIELFGIYRRHDSPADTSDFPRFSDKLVNLAGLFRQIGGVFQGATRQPDTADLIAYIRRNMGSVHVDLSYDNIDIPESVEVLRYVVEFFDDLVGWIRSRKPFYGPNIIVFKDADDISRIISEAHAAIVNSRDIVELDTRLHQIRRVAENSMEHSHGLAGDSLADLVDMAVDILKRVLVELERERHS